MQVNNHHTLWRSRQVAAFALMQTPTTIQAAFDADMRAVNPSVATVGEMITVGDCELISEELDIDVLLRRAGFYQVGDQITPCEKECLE